MAKLALVYNFYVQQLSLDSVCASARCTHFQCKIPFTLSDGDSEDTHFL